jgi:hypothetical protein
VVFQKEIERLVHSMKVQYDERTGQANVFKMLQGDVRKRLLRQKLVLDGVRDSLPLDGSCSHLLNQRLRAIPETLLEVEDELQGMKNTIFINTLVQFSGDVLVKVVLFLS